MEDSLSHDTEDLVEAALLLLARVEDMSPALRDAEVSSWCSKSPAHAGALDQARAEWSLFGELAPKPLSILQRFQLAGETTWASAADHPARAGIGLCLLLAFIAASFYQSEFGGTPNRIPELTQLLESHHHTARHDQEAVRYTTKRGEQRFISLPDESSLWLNWNSEVLVAVLEDEVHVDILRGDALVSVSDTTTRPLVVHAGDAVAYAPRTQFAIHSHSPHDAFFQVKEGVVTIVSADSNAPVMLGVTEQAYFENGKSSATSTTSLVSIAAWREGKLIFDERPLIDVLYELAHYTEKSLRVGSVIDPGDRISATYSLADADGALLQLADQYGLEVFHPTAQDAIVRSVDSRRL